MQKLVFGLMLLASSQVDAADLCMSVMSDPDKRSLNRDEQLIVEPYPIYPRRPQAERGYVSIEYAITAAGTVQEPVVLMSMPAALFDEAAIETVLKYRYKPRIVNGSPVVVEGVQKRISFNPSGEEESDEGKSATQRTKQAPAVSKKVYDEIMQAQGKIDAKDYNGALRVVENLLQYDKLTDYERSNVLNYIGFVHYNMDNLLGAMATYEEMLRIPSLDEQIRKQTLYILAQLNTTQERYTEAIRVLEEWFTLERDPTELAYVLYGQNLYQAQRCKDMIKPIETAIRIAELRGKPVKENWYGMLRNANSSINELETARDISIEMNKRWPSAGNSYRFAMTHARLGDRNKALAVLRELLAASPETDYVTSLHLAAADGDITLVTELLSNGSDVNLQTQGERTPLHWAVEFEQIEATKMLIDAQADVNAKTAIDFTALHRAAQDGFSLIVEMLIAAGADVNAVTKSVMNTPLLLAVMGEHTTVVEMLVAVGADVNAKTATDFTPLHQAAQKGSSSIVEILIAAGADVNAVTKSGTPPLFGAIMGKHEALVEILIAAGARVNVRSELGRTPLHWAAESGNVSPVEMLIAAGADVNSRDNKEWTPLTWAAYVGNAPVVEMLIVAGVELDPKSELGWTPLSWTAFWGDSAIATQLISQGADVAGVEMTADRGVARAQALLGYLYAQGHGVQQDDSLALRWYRAAAELNNADAEYAMGEMYLDGRGIRRNAKKAAQWFQAAAHQGHRDAQVKLSELYLNGVGVRKNPTEASMWSCFAGV